MSSAPAPKKYLRRGEVAAAAAAAAAPSQPSATAPPSAPPPAKRPRGDSASVPPAVAEETAVAAPAAPAVAGVTPAVAPPPSSSSSAPPAPAASAAVSAAAAAAPARLLSSAAAPFRPAPPAAPPRGASAAAAAGVAAALPMGATPDAHAYVAVYWKGLLHEWQDAAADAALWAQSAQWLAPLLRRLRARDVPADMLKLLVEISRAAEAREYAAAGDAYVRLAIGNARWPIGVTAVGIHDRAAREKVHEGKQAHVMHDEESRKFVTIIKRLLTFAQTKYPASGSHSFSS